MELDWNRSRQLWLTLQIHIQLMKSNPLEPVVALSVILSSPLPAYPSAEEYSDQEVLSRSATEIMEHFCNLISEDKQISKAIRSSPTGRQSTTQSLPYPKAILGIFMFTNVQEYFMYNDVCTAECSLQLCNKVVLTVWERVVSLMPCCLISPSNFPIIS